MSNRIFYFTAGKMLGDPGDACLYRDRPLFLHACPVGDAIMFTPESR